MHIFEHVLFEYYIITCTTSTLKRKNSTTLTQCAKSTSTTATTALWSRIFDSDCTITSVRDSPLTGGSQACTPSCQVCSKSELSALPHCSNQAPPRVQQLRLPELMLRTHFGQIELAFNTSGEIDTWVIVVCTG